MRHPQRRTRVLVCREAHTARYAGLSPVSDLACSGSSQPSFRFTYGGDHVAFLRPRPWMLPRNSPPSASVHLSVDILQVCVAAAHPGLSRGSGTIAVSPASQPARGCLEVLYSDEPRLSCDLIRGGDPMSSPYGGGHAAVPWPCPGRQPNCVQRRH